MAIYCNDLDTMLPVYLDGELQGHELGDLEHHLGTCDGCRARSEAEAGDRDRLRALLAGPPAPTHLRHGVLALLDRADREEHAAVAPPRRAWWTVALPATASMAAAAALAVFALDGATGRPAPSQPTARLSVETMQHEAVESRLRGAPVIPASSPSDMSRSVAEVLRVPVTAPVLRGGDVRGWQPTQIVGRVAVKLVYDVKVNGGAPYRVDIHLLNARDMVLEGQDQVRSGGSDLWLSSTGGLHTVTLRDARGIGYVFSSDMPRGDLIDVVVKSDLLDKVNDRLFGK